MAADPRRVAAVAALVAQLAQLALAAGFAGTLRHGWLLSLPLLVPLPWMVRRSSYAHAADSLLLVVYLGGLLTFLDLPAARLMACAAAVAFVGCVLFVRLQRHALR